MAIHRGFTFARGLQFINPQRREIDTEFFKRILLESPFVC